MTRSIYIDARARYAVLKGHDNTQPYADWVVEELRLRWIAQGQCQRAVGNRSLKTEEKTTITRCEFGTLAGFSCAEIRRTHLREQSSRLLGRTGLNNQCIN